MSSGCVQRWAMGIFPVRLMVGLGQEGRFKQSVSGGVLRGQN